jgi:clathrin heavy chain
MKHIEFPENIVFWKWASSKILAVITTTSVYHVNIANEQSKEVKIFERAGDLKEDQIIGYVLAPDEKWGALFGISSPDGGKTINGHIQLYLIEGGKQQLLEGHACTFGQAYIHNESHKSNLFCFVERKSGEKNSLVHITEISPPPEGCTKHKKNNAINYDPETPNDFPIALIVAEKYGMLYIVTKFGFLYIYELITCEQIYKTRISTGAIFAAARNYTNDGLLAMTKSGSLYGGLIDENSLLVHLMNNCKHIPNAQQLAFTIAGRYNLPGVDNMFLNQFNNYLVNGDYANAAKIASMSPGTLLRNSETIQKFKNLPQIPGQPQPLLLYFQKLLEKGKLTKLETMELCTPVLAQGRIELVKNWASSGKLDNSAELGDLVAKQDKALALKIYQDGEVHNKVVQLLNEQGRVDEATKYAQMKGIPVDYSESLRSMMDVNPEGALQFAKKLYEKDKNLNVHQIADMFLQRNRIQEFTSLCFDCMRQNKPEDARYQTKVLEVNIMIAPQIVESILQMKIWTLYDKPKIAALCEQKGLYQRALENYT